MLLIVARGWRKCCVSSCFNIRVNDIEKVVAVGDKVIKEDDWILLNEPKEPSDKPLGS